MADEKAIEKVAKETMNFMESSFKLGMDNVKLLQDQFSKLITKVVGETKTSGDEGKRILDNWLTVQKKGLEEFQKVITSNLEEYKKIIQGNIKKMEDMIKKNK